MGRFTFAYHNNKDLIQIKGDSHHIDLTYFEAYEVMSGLKNMVGLALRDEKEIVDKCGQGVKLTEKDLTAKPIY